MKKLKEEKIIVITGGTSGIGRASAKMFEDRGDKVIILSLDNPNNQANFFQCDVSNEMQVKEVFENIKLNFGRVDVLINCAGYGVSGATELIPTETAKQLFNVNVFGTYNCNKYALPLMNRGSKIINIASAMAFFPLPFRAMYASSKAAVNTMSLALRNECKPFGVDVCSICPGDVKTNFTKSRIKLFETNERYGERIQNAAGDLDGREEKRMPPETIAKEIFKQSNKKRSKAQVLVNGKYKILYFFVKILPLSWILWGVSKFAGGQKKRK